MVIEDTNPRRFEPTEPNVLNPKAKRNAAFSIPPSCKDSINSGASRYIEGNPDLEHCKS